MRLIHGRTLNDAIEAADRKYAADASNSRRHRAARARRHDLIQSTSILPVMGQMLEWIGSIILVASAGVIALWLAGAIYYDLCRGARWGRLVALGWGTGVIVLFAAWQPLWQPFVALLAVTAIFLTWWFRQKPTHNRDWEPCVAVLPRTVRDGDAITFENIRNFEYRSLEDFTARYETRTVHVSNLRDADIIFFNWGSRWMSHPVLVFDFGSDGRLCMSIEVRHCRQQYYSILRSIYRQQELIFIVADERDVILRRTKCGPAQEAPVSLQRECRGTAVGFSRLH
jgi:hypothetical protein